MSNVGRMRLGRNGRAACNGDAVPGIDANADPSGGDDLFIGQQRRRLIMYGVGNLPIGNQAYRLE